MLTTKDCKKNSIPWKQQVMGMACDAFWIEEHTRFFQQIMD
jgi:hypothetical protein